MKTLADIEDRIDEIRKEMFAIVKQMARLEKQDKLEGARAVELVERYTMLAFEASQFESSLFSFRRLAAQLMGGPCHGPH